MSNMEPVKNKASGNSENWPGVIRIKEIQAEVMRSLGLVRLSVNINAQTARVIKSIAKDSNISITEVIRRAISVAYFLYGESRSGRKIVVTDKRGREIKQIFLN